MNRRFSILILVALSLGVYVATAATPALLDDADASHALVSREMLQRGDWVVMYQDGIRYLEKAPLHYWMVAVSYKLLGQGAFQTRLPLVLSVVGLVLMVYFFARRWFGETPAFYSGLVICTSVGTWLFTRVMVPEAIFALELTALFYLFLRAWTGSLSPRVGYWGASVVMALAALTLTGYMTIPALLWLCLAQGFINALDWPARQTLNAPTQHFQESPGYIRLFRREAKCAEKSSPIRPWMSETIREPQTRQAKTTMAGRVVETKRQSLRGRRETDCSSSADR